MHQRVNASLAVQLAATWEQAAGPSCGGSAAAGAVQRAQQVAQLDLPDTYAEGLRECVWPGRAQVWNLQSCKGWCKGLITLQLLSTQR